MPDPFSIRPARLVLRLSPRRLWPTTILSLALLLSHVSLGSAQTLDVQLKREGAAAIALAARNEGDPTRGAILFHQPQVGCARCHEVGNPLASSTTTPIGPSLVALPADVDDTHLVESILEPSRAIRKGFETITIETDDGRTVVGLPVESNEAGVVLRHPTEGSLIEIERAAIVAEVPDARSAMPEGLAATLGDRRAMLDLVAYLSEIRRGGAERARELQPPESLFALRLPDYESQVDHAGLIRSLDSEAFARGEAIYLRLCINCHGDHEQPGSLPTAPRFAEGRLRNGADPYAMYRTLTHGFGFMAPQTWMVPRQKYDVIHYVREAYFRERTDGQYAAIDDRYLAGLPVGDTFGPEPVESEPWAEMDYGPSLLNTYQVPTTGAAPAESPHLVYKGLAVRLDPGPGGVARGSAWMLYDLDLMSFAAAWSSDTDAPRERFIDWNGIHFNGRHQIHPTIVGRVAASHVGPGWGEPSSGSLIDAGRTIGRDGRAYGPLSHAWAERLALHAAGDRSILEYRVGSTRVLEMPGQMSLATSGDATSGDSTSLFTRTLQVGPRDRPLRLAIASLDRTPDMLDLSGRTIRVASDPPRRSSLAFDGRTRLETAAVDELEMTERDFTLSATILTERDGTIACRTRPEAAWVPDGKSFFVRGGRLCYDIGWVGVVTSRDRVDDGQPHHVAMTWSEADGRVTFVIDGRESGGGTLRPSESREGEVFRIGYTAPNFPAESGFVGTLRDVTFHDRCLTARELNERSAAALASFDAVDPVAGPPDDAPIAVWPLRETEAATEVREAVAARPTSLLDAGAASVDLGDFVATVIGSDEPRWSLGSDRAEVLCLELPAGDETLTFTVAFGRVAPEHAIDSAPLPSPVDLEGLLAAGAAARWPTTIETTVDATTRDGAFDVDTLRLPERNPWSALIRSTGLDFTADGDSLLMTTWDGDVWRVDGLNAPPDTDGTRRLVWRRIASGLFQPLGILLVDDVPYVTCRDQLVVLRDRNGDGEIDSYECFNDDHQVTEHFHEFAMGLQRDSQGRFLYAKSARHALPAIVPHHGTLLRVSADGRTTEIVATGFRAANGVCLNPDGTFIVTDQEGHWNPKNRINWVHEGGFYGNMFGYHDVVDPSDDAMAPPLCWITNAFDRSPAELLWVESPRWGALDRSLLNLSYGYGKVFVVPFERIEGLEQGGMCELPIGDFPTGVMRGRFHRDGQLYLCGMFAWAGSATEPGGLYRIRPTDRPATVPLKLRARTGAYEIELSDPVDRVAAADPKRYEVRVWGLKRTADYGSNHVDEHPLEVTGVEVSEDGRRITLSIPELAPTWGMSIVADWIDAQQRPIRRTIHATIHRLGP
ncbi:MAG TPA: c-type cytochrome [Pirellulaceae bacterium]|nr:c-type cytochrome [Pirellulaceae bacterium]